MTQLAATKSYIFDPSNTIPKAIIFVVDRENNYLHYTMEFNDAMQRAWQTVLLKAVRFYVNSLLPKYLSTLSLSEAGTLTPQKEAMRPVGAILGEIDHAVDVNAIDLMSPGVKIDKVVRRTNGKKGVVVKVDDLKQRAVVQWNDNPRSRERWTEFGSLIVIPSGVHSEKAEQSTEKSKLVRPDRKGQKVRIVGGCRQQLFGKTAIVKSMSSTMCAVVLEEGDGSLQQRELMLSLVSVHALDPPRKVTVPPSEHQIIIPKDKFPQWMEEYQRINSVRLINNLTPGAFIDFLDKKISIVTKKENWGHIASSNSCTELLSSSISCGW